MRLSEEFVRFCWSGPALVGEAGAGEVDDAVDAAEGGRIEAPRRRVPADLAGGRLAPDDACGVVTVCREVVEQRRSDQSVRSGHGDAHWRSVRSRLVVRVPPLDFWWRRERS